MGAAFTSRHRLTTHEELLLRLGQRATGRAADWERIAQLLAGCDQAGVMEALAWQRLTALFGKRLEDAVGSAIPETLRARFAADAESTRKHAVVHDLALERVLEALAEHDIRAAPLKGPRFAARIHGDIGLRAVGDLDVLVPTDALDAAVEVVASLGWMLPSDHREPDGRPLLHYAMPHAGGLPTIELHWRVHWYERAFADDALKRGRASSTGVQLKPADELAFLLLFVARDAFSGLRLTVDAVSWLDQDDTGAWSELRDIARAYPQLERVLRIAQGQVLRVAEPCRAHRRIHRSPRIAAAERLADPLARISRKQQLAERGLFDILIAPRSQVGAAVRRQVLPSVEVLATRRKGLPTDLDRTATTRVHAVRTLRRYALAPIVRFWRPTRPIHLGPG